MSAQSGHITLSAQVIDVVGDILYTDLVRRVVKRVTASTVAVHIASWRVFTLHKAVAAAICACRKYE